MKLQNLSHATVHIVGFKDSPEIKMLSFHMTHNVILIVHIVVTAAKINGISNL